MRSKAFYIDKLGFVEATDVEMGDGYRWCTVAHPAQPELEVTLMKPGPPLDEEDAAAMQRMLDKGSLNAGGTQHRRLPTDVRGAVGQRRRVHSGARRPPLWCRGGLSR